MENLSTNPFIQATPKSSRRTKNLRDEERQAIYEFLLRENVDGKTKFGSIPEVANLFFVSTRTIQRIWAEGKSKINDQIVRITSKQPGRVGRKRIQPDICHLHLIPLRQRTNIRSLANALGLLKSMVHRLIKEGLIRPHSNALKPFLTEENKKSRLMFCLSMLDSMYVTTRTSIFKDMLNTIHIDDKWFYISPTSQKYYILPNEVEPTRTCKSKRFITKVVFLAAVVRTRFDTSGNCVFSGKIGIFPFTYKEPAKRGSKNRTAGTMEIKPILSVTKEVKRRCLIEEVLPAIRAKWPRDIPGPIFIQQDNAQPHINPTNVEFTQDATKDGFDIQLMFQPPNSPDMNVLDLGFFRAIQSLQYQKSLNSVGELLNAVKQSFDEISPKSLNHVFLSWQSCMIEVMKAKGGNNYKLPHMRKESLERRNNLPFQISCDPSIVEDCVNFLNQ